MRPNRLLGQKKRFPNVWSQQTLETAAFHVGHLPEKSHSSLFCQAPLKPQLRDRLLDETSRAPRTHNHAQGALSATTVEPKGTLHLFSKVEILHRLHLFLHQFWLMIGEGAESRNSGRKLHGALHILEVTFHGCGILHHPERTSNLIK